MVLDTLGESIDIHGGGKDLIFPHHENEIAQSEAYTGKPFAKYWVHNGLITINGQKMSKSLGNSMTIKQALEKYNAEVIRYAMLEKHYSTDIDLNEKVFSLAEKQLYYFYNTLANINKFKSIYCNYADGKVVDDLFIEEIDKNFKDSMDDDFNTAVALAHMFSICKYVNSLVINKKYTKEDISATLTQIKEKTKQLFSIFGLLQETPEDFMDELKRKHLNHLGITKAYIDGMILQRSDAKANKDYEMADRLRNALLEQGIILNDNNNGANWDIKELYSINAV
jgi:cysteinyl-tRNA synthetase